MLASARMTGSTLMCILNYHRWAALLKQALLQMDGLLHYVIMPNHIHFLVGIQPKADGGGATQPPPHQFLLFPPFKGRVAHRAGHSVFQRPFYDHIIRTETDYWAIVQ